MTGGITARASERKLDGMPSLLPLYARAALGGAIASLPASGLIGRLPLIPAGGGAAELAATGLAVDGVVADVDALAAYCRVCGFTLGDALPVTFPHVLAFPLQMKLMTDDAFPFPLLGLVHIDNSITQHRPIGTAEPVDLAVRAEDLRPHPKGTAISLIAEARAGGELVWEETGTILHRGPGQATGAVLSGPEPVADDVPASSQWRLDGDLGRRYAAASGDRNPIHLHRLSAKALGFRCAIAHGMWTKGRCLAQLEAGLPPAYTVETRFRKPVLLPGTVGFAAVDRGDGRVSFAVRSSRPGRDGGQGGPTVHLQGSIVPAGRI
jgi:acyl dehydratase